MSALSSATPTAVVVVKAPKLKDSFVPRLLQLCLKHLDDLEGRDKFSKLVQYGARIMMYQLLQSDPKSDLGARCKSLMGLIGNARKLGRLFKTLSEYQKLIEVLDKSGDAHKQALEISTRLGFGYYWFFDNLSWLVKGKVVTFDEKEVSWQGSVGWTIGTFSALSLSLIKLFENLQAESDNAAKLAACSSSDAGKAADAAKSSVDPVAEIARLQSERVDLMIAVVKNSGDFVCASNSVDIWEKLLGYKLNDGVIGVAGFVAALCSNYTIFNKLKL